MATGPLQTETPGGRPRRRPRWCKAFLSVLRTTGNVCAACAESKVSRPQAYRYRGEHPDFARAWRVALRESGELLELEALRRAHDGVDEPVVYQGEVMGVWVDRGGRRVAEGTRGARMIPLTVKKYSDALLMFLLRGTLPKKYRDRHTQHDHSGTVTARVSVAVSLDEFRELPLEERVRILCEQVSLPAGN